MQEPSFNTWTIIFLFAAVQGLFLAVVLFSEKKGDKLANRILAFLILSFTIMLLYYVAFWTRYNAKLLIFEGFTWPVPLLFGPLVYLYLKKITSAKLQKADLLHFIPFLLAFIYLAPFMFSSVSEKQMIMEEIRTGGQYRVFSYISIFAVNISLLVYTSLIFNIKRKYKSKHSGHQDNYQERTKWFGRVTWFFAGFTFSYVSYYLLLFSTGYYRSFDYLISFSMSAFIYMVGYAGYRQPEVFWNLRSEKASDKKYSRSSLSEEEMIQLINQISQLMESEHVYQNSDLRIYDLATKLNTSPNYISQTINQKMNKSFNDYINSYRIREAKSMLRNSRYQHEKIMSIAFDVGFNNKASFNTAFRKFVGMSPSEYRNSASPVFSES